MEKPQSRQFVILHHTGYGRDHWDLMLEEVETLATWKLYHDPRELPKRAVELFRIGDHRKAYLDYEGPVSGDRGQVTHVCSGTYQMLEKNSQVWRVEFLCRELCGIFEFRQLDENRWSIANIRDPI